MSKFNFRGKPTKKKAGAPNNPQNMMAQVQKMQQDMLQQRESLEQEEYTVTTGGGAITVVITGHQRLKSIKINPEVIDPEDAEMLQDLILTAVNTAIEQSQSAAAEKMEGLTGGLGLGDLLAGI
ncbi:MAG: YbaB/EbfC family nucleoid-associated protein [Chloroflexi bacterium]|nr:YbaB/EbfC family nucleoid-associated protein [Chloroflexota bacterium]MBP8060012.1 YbaB/EbfC family nucleoid-associated protein [Chloroflexota bacterium]